jgi:hypothetical protein
LTAADVSEGPLGDAEGDAFGDETCLLVLVKTAPDRCEVVCGAVYRPKRKIAVALNKPTAMRPHRAGVGLVAETFIVVPLRIEETAVPLPVSRPAFSGV